jgi:nicotinamidase-related amidase
MSEYAVIIIYMLNDFVTGNLKCERAQHIIPNLKKLVKAARKNGITVIYSNDAHYPEDHEVVARWGSHAIKGTKGAEVIPELKPEAKDYLIDKRTYSGFYETGLEPLLRSLGVKKVVLTGLHTNMCVRHTAADAFFRGYGIIVATDGVEAFTQEDHESGLKYLEYVYNAQLKTVDEIIKEFSK